MTLSRAELAQYVDHTLLKPESTPADVEALIAEAAELGVFSVCVSPSMLPVSTPAGVAVATVCGFPSGKHHSFVKAAEAALSVEQGADEVDMVIDIAAANEGRFDNVQSDIAAVRGAVPEGKILKVVIGGLIIGTINNGLNMVGVSAYYQQVAMGALIVLAVTLDRFFGARGKR